jgi:hypothetical protein
MKEKIWLFIGLFFFISSIFFISGCDTTSAEDDTGTYEYEQSLTYAQLQKEIKTFEDWGDDVYCNNKCRVMTVPKGNETWSNISKCRIALCRQTDRCTKGVSGIIERTKTTCTESYVPKEDVAIEPTVEDVPVDTGITDTTVVDTVKTDSTTTISDSTVTVSDSTLTDIATQPEETIESVIYCNMNNDCEKEAQAEAAGQGLGLSAGVNSTIENKCGCVFE